MQNWQNLILQSQALRFRNFIPGYLHKINKNISSQSLLQECTDKEEILIIASNWEQLKCLSKFEAQRSELWIQHSATFMDLNIDDQ